MRRKSSSIEEIALPKFRIIESGGLPEAAFDKLDPVRNWMLSYILYPYYPAASALYQDTVRIDGNKQLSWKYEDSSIIATCDKDGLIIESLLPDHRDKGSLRIKLSLRDAKTLLLHWAAACLRWEAKKQAKKTRVKSKKSKVD